MSFSHSLDVLNPVATVLAATIGAYLTMKIFRSEKSIDTARERLDAVYCPLFQVAEQCLYQKIQRAECDRLVVELKVIATKGRYLTHSKLNDLIRIYERSDNCTQEQYERFEYEHFADYKNEFANCYLTHWFEICAHIDQTYDLLSKRCFMPIRTRSYRLNHKQYINDLSWTLAFFRMYLPSLLLPVMIALFMMMWRT